ncbi:tellurite resistance protein [Sinorhizobium fredii]
MSASLSQHEALVYVMVMMSAVDRSMSDDEFARIGGLVRFLPAFDGFDEDRLIHIGRECAAQLAAPEGLDVTLEMVRESLPQRHYETAYALAVEIAAADQRIRTEESGCCSCCATASPSTSSPARRSNGAPSPAFASSRYCMFP